jgi:cell division protein FtsA
MNKQEQPIIVGLDIGTTKVVAIAGRKNEYGKLEILGFGKAESAGVSHGVVMNIEQCIRSIEQAIEKCLSSNPNLEVKEVYVGIAGQHIKSLQTRGDRVRMETDEEISKADIDLLIKDQYKTYIPAGDQIIDIIPQEYTVDNTQTTFSPIGMSGVKIGANFHIITGDRNAIRNIKRCVDKSGLNTKDLVLQPLASAAAVMSDEDLEAGVAIVDIGGGTTDMAVFYDGILKHTAVIPYAGVNITNDIRNGLGVLRAQAEQMKVQFGTALADEANANAYITIPGLRGLPPKEISVKNLAHIIQARMQEILDYVVYHLKQIDLDKRLYGGIILTGGGAQLKHIIQLTEYVTGLGARIGYPNEHLAGGHAEALMNPMYSTCIGLILRGYHDYENGRLRFVGDGGNMIHAELDEPIPSIRGEQPQTAVATAPDPVAEWEDKELTRQKNEKRNETMKRLFDRMKGKFMSLFEEVDDQEIE